MKKTLFIVALVLLSAGMFAQGHGGFIGISIGPLSQLAILAITRPPIPMPDMQRPVSTSIY